jgi:hypothetical protein
MKQNRSDLKRPIRVVLFCGGPSLDRAVIQFVSLLEEHPEIEFLGGFCQSSGQTFSARLQDLWARRGVLALPILVANTLNFMSRLIMHPLSEVELRKKIARISNRLQFVPNIHAGEVLERLISIDADLGLIYGGPILKPSLFEIPRFGTLGIHHGKVPEYRGKKTTFWAIFNGEKAAGVTIQHINAGVDAGDVVEQGEVLTEGKTLKTVSRELEQLGFKLYIRSIVAIKRGTACFNPQESKKGKLYRDPNVIDMIRFMHRRMIRKFNSVKSLSTTGR